MVIDVESLSCVWLSCNTMHCSPLGSSIHGISQARILEWVAVSFSRGSSRSREWTHFSCVGRWILYHWATRRQLLFSRSVVSNSLRPCGLQPTRLPCPSPFPEACSNSCPLSQWCHLPFSSCPQSFPTSQSFPVSWLLASGGQSIGTSASASVLPKNIQDWFPLWLTDWISLQSKGLLRVFSNTTVQKQQFFSAPLSYGPTLTSIHDHWKNHSLY